MVEINPGRGINRSDNPKIYEKNIYYRGYQALNHIAGDSTYFETQGIIRNFFPVFLARITLTFKVLIHSFKDTGVDQLYSAQSQRKIDYFRPCQESQPAPGLLFPAFFQIAGERPLGYIHVKRIERAQYLIAATGLSYNEIAGETGFENVSQFSRVFKKITGLTPGEYKKNELLYSTR